MRNEEVLFIICSSDGLQFVNHTCDDTRSTVEQI